MVSELSLPQNYVNGVKFYFMLVIILLPLCIYFGIYYYLSDYVNSKIKSLILNKLKHSPYIGKYIYIVSIIVRFVIFFGLLKLILQVCITYLFFNFEEPGTLNCEMAEMGKTLATVISIMFFIIYEIILFPFSLIHGTEDLFILIISLFKMFINYIIDNFQKKLFSHDKTQDSLEIMNIQRQINILTNLSNNVNKFKQNFSKKARPDIDTILDLVTSGIKETNESYIVKFGNLISSFLSKKNNDPSKKLETNINSIASSVSGKLVIPLLYLGIIYLTMYYYFSEHNIIRIIVFVLIVLLFLYFIYGELIIMIGMSIMAGVGLGINKLTSSNKINNVKNDIQLLGLDAKQIGLGILHVIKNFKLPKK